MENLIFNDINKLLLFDQEETKFNDSVINLFKIYKRKYHEYILQYFLFIYDNYFISKQILEINILLLHRFKEQNFQFYIDYNEIINDKNIQYVQNNINKFYIKDILYYLNNKNLDKILVKDKITLKLFKNEYSHTFFKYLKNIDNLIANINNFNINIYLKILYKNNCFTTFNQNQKKIVLYKIYKYIYSNPNSIIYVKEIYNEDSNFYKDFIIKCCQKNIQIWKYIDLNDYFLDKILQKYSKCIKKNIYLYIHDNKISEKIILQYIDKYPLIINYYPIKSEQFMIQIILKLMNKKNSLKRFINYILFNEFHTSSEVFLSSKTVINLLLLSDSCYYTNIYLDLLYIRFDLYFICNILNQVECHCCFKLFNRFIYSIHKHELLTLIQANYNILFDYNKTILLQEYGGIQFIKDCIIIEPLSILYFKDEFISYKELLLYNSCILEYLQNEECFKELFIYSMKNYNNNHSLFITNYTYDKYFLNANNAYILLSNLHFPKEIKKQIYMYLI